MLWVPEREAARQAENARAEQARVLGAVELHHDVAFWNRELRRIDPYVQVVKAPANSQRADLKPGYFHILRIPPAQQPTIIAHETDDGGYRELDSGIFQTLRNADMWNSERQRDRQKRIREAEKAQARQEDREREERVEQIMDRAKSLWNPGVSMAPGWRYRAGARRG